MVRPIRYYGDPVLRRRARAVKVFDEELAQLAADMLETMHEEKGVGLAAPQVGSALRLFVAAEYRNDEEGELEHVRDHIMVNPSIAERRGSQSGQEGCLSIPGLYVDDLERDQLVRVRYQDVDGAERELSAEGYFARVIQHEYDHLEGVLFFDRLPEAQRNVFLDEHRSDLATLQRQAKAFIKDLKSGTEKSRS